MADRFEIAHISPDLLRFVAQHTGDAQLAELMKPENKAALADWAWGRQSVDLLGQCEVTASVDEWLSVLKPLQPRLYSISSSPKVHPREVHLTVSPVRYSFQGVPRRGVCSTYLADRSPGDDTAIYVRTSSNFRPPSDPHTPMIMIGPGTAASCRNDERSATPDPIGCSSANSTPQPTITTAARSSSCMPTGSSPNWTWHTPGTSSTRSTYST